MTKEQLKTIEKEIDIFLEKNNLSILKIKNQKILIISDNKEDVKILENCFPDNFPIKILSINDFLIEECVKPRKEKIKGIIYLDDEIINKDYVINEVSKRTKLEILPYCYPMFIYNGKKDNTYDFLQKIWNFKEVLDD